MRLRTAHNNHVTHSNTHSMATILHSTFMNTLRSCIHSARFCDGREHDECETWCLGAGSTRMRLASKPR